MAATSSSASPPSVLAKLESLSTELVRVSEITRAKLLRGAAREPERGAALGKLIGGLLSRLLVLGWNGAERYARIRADLEGSGSVIGNTDVLIGARALHVDAVLVTNDARHFGRIDGLRLENRPPSPLPRQARAVASCPPSLARFSLYTR